ncbi:helix-turn-helix domain-containing protein, partial [Butyricicoccus sp.]
MQYEERFSKRLIQLRMQKGVSAREMSLSIGQNASYINNIETGKALPSMNGFFYICEYLNISPQEFFNETAEAPQKVRELAEKASALPQQQI